MTLQETSQASQASASPHVLVLASWYPSHYRPLEGIFIQEQVRLMSEHVQLGLVYPELRSLRVLRPSALPKQHWHYSEELEFGFPTYRHHGWNIPVDTLQSQAFLNPALNMVKRYIKRYGVPDVFHAHATFWAGLAAHEAARLYNKPYAVTVHWNGFMNYTFSDYKQKMATKILGNAARVISVSDALAANLRPYTKAAAQDPIRIIHNPIDTNHFTPPPEPRERGQKYQVVSVAGLNEVKNLHILIEAFAQAFPHSAELTLGGEGPERGRLEALIRNLSLENRVTLLGGLDKHQIRDLLWRADLFASTSRTETFGMAIAEALATGLPVVATRSGGPESIIEEGMGLLTQHDVASVAAGLKQASEMSFEPERIRRSVVERYSSGVIAKTLFGLYDELRS